ncbi:hypothetical protein BDP27DRAFT_1405735 [Rhodocollybia butyracea]|uniref:Uncharacterized protein n=1 Tax=Rhodocollybia butyracea TaxID=206335 RepID=A0A9P5PI14_9AGAR|nr:hypothetical protein BDP27DRAFT_1405735 [Rhodocollybia butyracea]
MRCFTYTSNQKVQGLEILAPKNLSALALIKVPIVVSHYESKIEAIGERAIWGINPVELLGVPAARVPTVAPGPPAQLQPLCVTGREMPRQVMCGEPRRLTDNHCCASARSAGLTTDNVTVSTCRNRNIETNIRCTDSVELLYRVLQTIILKG